MNKNLYLSLIAAILLIAGCATPTPDGPYQGDRILYNADSVIVLADGLFTAFMQWEYAYRDDLAKWPEVKKTADRVRKDYRKWLSSAFEARDAYKLYKTEENLGKLTVSLRFLRNEISVVNKYMKP